MSSRRQQQIARLAELRALSEQAFHDELPATPSKPIDELKVPVRKLDFDQMVNTAATPPPPAMATKVNEEMQCA